MDEKLKAVLDEAGITRVRFYQYTTPIVNNIFTTCLLLGEDKKAMARGVSICSLLDCYRKKVGKNRALGRATRALLGEKNSGMINPEPYRWKFDEVLRSFKAKTQKDVDFFEANFVPILQSLDEEWNMVELSRGKDTNHIKFLFYVPRTYPIMETAQFYDYKSEFEPTLQEFEKNWIANCK